jgi:hypothetical protein
MRAARHAASTKNLAEADPLHPDAGCDILMVRVHQTRLAGALVLPHQACGGSPMDLLRSLLSLLQRKPPKKPTRSRRAGTGKSPARSGSRRGKRELTAAQAVREAELRG